MAVSSVVAVIAPYPPVVAPCFASPKSSTFTPVGVIITLPRGQYVCVRFDTWQLKLVEGDFYHPGTSLLVHHYCLVPRHSQCRVIVSR